MIIKIKLFLLISIFIPFNILTYRHIAPRSRPSETYVHSDSFVDSPTGWKRAICQQFENFYNIYIHSYATNRTLLLLANLETRPTMHFLDEYHITINGQNFTIPFDNEYYVIISGQRFPVSNNINNVFSSNEE